MKGNLCVQNQWGATFYDVCTAAARSNLERVLTCISRALICAVSVWGASNCYAKGPLQVNSTMALHNVCSSALSQQGLSRSWELRVGRHDSGASVPVSTDVDVSIEGLCPMLYTRVNTR
jgi:hypothetical protein